MIDKIKLFKKPCIYFLYSGEDIVYIGQTTNLYARIGAHIRDRKVFDYFSWEETEEHKLNDKEKYLIEKHSPFYNKNYNPNNSIVEFNYKMKYDFFDKNDIKMLLYHCGAEGVLDLIRIILKAGISMVIESKIQSINIYAFLSILFNREIQEIKESINFMVNLSILKKNSDNEIEIIWKEY